MMPEFTALNGSEPIDWSIIPTDAQLVIDHPPQIPTQPIPGDAVSGDAGWVGTHLSGLGFDPHSQDGTAPTSDLTSDMHPAHSGASQKVGTHWGSSRGSPAQWGDAQKLGTHSSNPRGNPLLTAATREPSSGFAGIPGTEDSRQSMQPAAELGVLVTQRRRLLARPSADELNGPLGPLSDAVTAFQALGYDCPLFARKFGPEAAPAVEAVLQGILQEPQAAAPLRRAAV